MKGDTWTYLGLGLGAVGLVVTVVGLGDKVQTSYDDRKTIKKHLYFTFSFSGMHTHSNDMTNYFRLRLIKFEYARNTFYGKCVRYSLGMIKN